jgi:SAM-dependent methyltransferase
MALDVAGFKQGQRQVWSAGDYPDIARLIEAAAELLVEKAGVQAGQDVLDVATGSGNVALVAAQRGAKVTGLDITPELLEAARGRAAEAGMDVEWVEGDAEELPFEDASFDRVLSAFGTMFAPRHEVAAGELLRVCRPGGLVAVAAWTPDGLNGRMFRTVTSHMPPPPPELKPPALWGDEDHMRGLLERPGVTLEFHLGRVVFEFPSVDEWMAYGEERLGPMVMARAALEPQGKYEALRGDMEQLYTEANTAEDGSMRCEAEYLVTIARKA